MRETESLVKKIADDGPPRADARTAKPADVHTRAAEERLRLALGTRVRIVRQGSRGRIEIDFGSEDELIRIFEQLTDERQIDLGSTLRSEIVARAPAPTVSTDGRESWPRALEQWSRGREPARVSSPPFRVGVRPGKGIKLGSLVKLGASEFTLEDVERVTNKTAAIRYARALLDVALKEQADLSQIEEQLARLSICSRQHPTLAKVLLNPAVPVPRKRAAVGELTARLQIIAGPGEAARAARRARSPGAAAGSAGAATASGCSITRTSCAPKSRRRCRCRPSARRTIERGLAQVTGRTVTLVDARRSRASSAASSRASAAPSTTAASRRSCRR